jgi:glutathione S-transferase
VVGSYYDNVLRFLEVHHSGEDHLVTPLLAERCSGDDAALVMRIAAQHHHVLGPLHHADEAVAAWKASADPAAARDAVAALGALGDALNAHLDDEERYVLPIAASVLTAPEWGALPEHGLQNFTGDNIWLILGLIRETMTEVQRQAMLAHMPPPVVDAWQSTGETEFQAFIGEVRSPL